MFGHVTDLPRFENYHEALAYFEQTKGVRGRTHIKPLKTTRRSPDEYRIDVNPNGGVECWLYRTPVLIYYPDRLVVNCYDSRTTCSFVDDVAPRWLWSQMRGGTQIVRVVGEGAFVGNHVEVSVDGVYNPIAGQVSASKLNKVVLNKTRAAQARKAVKDVVELARVTSKLDGYWMALRCNDDHIEDNAMWHLRRALQTWGAWAMTFETLKQKLYLMEYQAQQCYDYEPVPYGTIPKEWRVAE